MDEDELRSELVAILREGREDIVESLVASYPVRYPHMASRLAEDPEIALSWTASHVDAFINALDDNNIVDLGYRAFQGWLITQSADVFYDYYNHMEYVLLLAQTAQSILFARMRSSAPHGQRLLSLFENFTIQVLKRDTLQFGEQDLRPGILVKDAGQRFSFRNDGGTSAEALKSFGDAANRFDLTARELELCELVSRGFTNKEIASQLKISVATVKNHISNILTKLNLGNRTELALWYNHR